MDSYIKYSVLKVEEVEDFQKDKYNYTRVFTFESKLPSRTTGIADFKGNWCDVFVFSNFAKFDFEVGTGFNPGKYKYLIIEHEVDYPVSKEDYWKELGELENPTITQIKCYQYIINNLI